MAQQVQVMFDGGMNGVSSPGTIGPNEVQTSTNIDFSLEWGGLVCRRGMTAFGSYVVAEPVKIISRNYSSATIDQSPWYGIGATTIGRGTSSGTGVAWSSIGSVGTGTPILSHFQNYTYLAQGSKAFKDNGSNTWNWILEAVPAAPTVLLSPDTTNGTATGIAGFTGFANLFTAIDGTVTASSTVTDSRSPQPSFILTTATAGTGTVITLSATVTNSNWNIPDSTSWLALGLNAGGLTTNTIGPYGVDSLFIALSNPAAVTKISRDVSIGDATFSNYWHTEIGIKDLEGASPDIQSVGIANQVAKNILETLYGGVFNTTSRLLGTPISYFGNTAAFVHTWSVPRTDYGFVGNMNNPDWTNIHAVRVIIEGFDSTQVIVGGWQTSGSLQYSLIDTNVGYVYYVTHARVENGVVVFEGPPSPPSKAQKIFNSSFNLDVPAYAGTGTSGANYYGVYRQGGLLAEPHLVDYFEPLVIENSLMFDWGYPDLAIIDNPILVQDILGTWTSANAVSEPWNSRLFLGVGNDLRWTLPGQPSLFPEDSDVTVGDGGDKIQGLIVWDRLVIINQQSVFEMDGTIFEGLGQDWVLKRSGSRRGSVAPRTIIKTPYGIPLLGYDGLSMYTPGYGLDQPVDWVMDKIGDAWRGTGVTDPSILKGGRVPAIDLTNIQNCLAAFANDNLYLAVPITSSTSGYPSVIFVINFAHKVVWVYDYFTYGITGMFWDQVANRLIICTTGGEFLRLETGHVDLSGGNAIAQTWRAKTRAWTTSSDMVLQNLSVENLPNGEIVARAIVDNTSTVVLGTLTGSVKTWSPLALNGTIGNNVVFQFDGTKRNSANSGVFGLSWDQQIQPPRVTYWRSEYDNGGTDQQKIWDVHFDEIEVVGTGTVSSVTFVDNVAIVGNVIVGPTGGKVLVPVAFPPETYGYIAYTTYTGPQMKIWRTYNATRPEPAPVASYVTDRFTLGDGQSGNATQEFWWHDVLTDMNCQGNVVLGTVFVNEVATTTFTYTGSSRIGYNQNLPSETYGVVIFVRYTAVTGAFKHYTTYYSADVEPTRDLFSESDITPYPSENFVKTWLPTLNPQGGTVLGTVLIDGNIIQTETFTGSIRHTYEIGLPNITKGKTIKAQYTGVIPFKHYKPDKWETAPKPFGKKTWVVNYFRPQGASELGMGRYYTIDIQATTPTVALSTWLVDGVAVLTNTLVLGSERVVFDQKSFPPVARGYLFQQQLTADNPVNIWRSNIDFENITVKGLVRNVVHGTPLETEV